MTLRQLIGAEVDVNDALVADADLAVAAAPGLRYLGFSCKESDGTPAVATFRILRGDIATGTVLDTVELAANESAREWYGPEGFNSPEGISIDWIVGTVDVHIRHKTLNN